MTDTIKIVQFQDKYKDQVVDLVKRETAANVGVKRLKWITLFFKRNGFIVSTVYVGTTVYIFNFLLSLFISQNNIFVSAIILASFIFFVILPQLSKKLAKQAVHYSESIAENDLDDIKGTYLSQDDKNFWVAVDEYDNVCGCVSLSNQMPMETQYHLGKYIKENDGIKVAEVKRMVVNPNYRRRGIGIKLCNEAINFAKQKNFRAIVNTTVTLNQPLIGLYKKAGFFKVSSFFFQVLWKVFGIQVEVYLKLL
ncbi:hypothetical protein ABPG72_017058 [Tetrahymena utriculariae]